MGQLRILSTIQHEKGRFKVDFDFSLTPEDPASTLYYDNIIACTGFKYVDKSMFDPETVPVKLMSAQLRVNSQK